jgi:hypothetical protein
MPRSFDGWRRRRVLAGVAALGSVAGCSGADDGGGASGTAGTPTRGTVTGQGGRSTTDADVVFDGGGSAALASALEHLASTPGSTLRVAPGTHTIDASQSPRADDGKGTPAHLVLSGATDARIVGPDATLAFTDGSLGGIHCHACDGVAVDGLTLDWRPPPFAQGDVVSMDEDRRTVTVALHDRMRPLDSPTFETASHIWATVHDPETGTFVSGQQAPGPGFKRIVERTHLGGNRWRLRIGEQSTFVGLETGNQLVVNRRRGGRQALSFVDCAEVALDGVTVRASPSWAVNSKLCDGFTARNVTVAPAPESDRLVSTNSDGIHATNNASGPVVENCHFEKLHDDAMVVDTRTLPVESFLDDRTVAVADVVTTWVRPGDQLRPITGAGVKKPVLPPVADVELRFSGPRAPGRPKAITFESPVADSVATGDFLLNETLSNDGYVLRNNTVRNSRARPIRLTAGSGEVLDNHVDGSNGIGIEMEFFTQSHFAPKGWVDDVTIEGNRVERVGRNWLPKHEVPAIGTISRTTEAVTGTPHENLRIRNNELARNAFEGIVLRDTATATVAGNTIAEPNLLRGPNGGYGMIFDRSKDLTVRDNVVRGSRTQVRGFARNVDATIAEASGNRLVVDGESRSARIAKLVPVTFQFNETVRPADQNPDSTDDRPLALQVDRLALLGPDGTVIRAVDVGGGSGSDAGGDESGADFGNGVFGPSSDGERSWRWFGGSNAQARVFFRQSELERASTLRVRGRPIADGITAHVGIDGSLAGSMTFESAGVMATHTVPLE